MNRQPYEGLLHKYTNVVKGWQFRWFVLNYDRGILEYHVNEDSKKHKARGSIHLAGAVISPSDEDSQTFTVNSASGDVYKLRAADARERQQWVNKLRSVAEYHTQVIAETNPPLPSHEQRYGAGASPAPSPQESQASLLRAQQRVMYSTATLYDAFSSVREALMQVELNQGSLSRSIEALPSSGTSLKCTDPDLLILKATSQATLLCMEQCLSILQQQQQAASFQQTGVTGGATTEWIEPRSQFSKLAVPSTPVSTISTSQNKPPPSETLTSLPETVVVPDLQVNSVADLTPGNAVVDEDEDEDEVPDSENRDESELGPVEEHKSVILSILSQLKLGMDLTRVVLPTFILESRSLLEMFADYLGHPDLFVRIPDGVTPEERMMSMVEWYLTSFHVGRKGDIAKKPYNPIIGETFTCSWHLPKDDRGDVQTATKIRYISEQVSHHPPVSAFYVECPEKNMCMNAHVWTKSKFMGMSIGVNMVGEVVLYLGSHNEEYTFSLPSAFARSILTIPWVELGGKIAIACPKTGCSALVIFHTKTFYGGKLHKVTAEVKNPSNSTICKIQGEWNGTLEFTYSDGTSKIIDTNKLKLYRKYVRRIDKQAPNESRKLWYHVTTSLRESDMKRTTTHKHFLEEKQRQEEKERLTKKEVFPTKHFKPYGEKWFYKNMLINKAKVNNPS